MPGNFSARCPYLLPVQTADARRNTDTSASFFTTANVGRSQRTKAMMKCRLVGQKTAPSRRDRSRSCSDVVHGAINRDGCD